MPRLKVDYQKQRTGKESMKMIIRHTKLNILLVQNEYGGDMRWIIISLNKNTLTEPAQTRK